MKKSTKRDRNWILAAGLFVLESVCMTCGYESKEFAGSKFRENFLDWKNDDAFALEMLNFKPAKPDLIMLHHLATDEKVFDDVQQFYTRKNQNHKEVKSTYRASKKSSATVRIAEQAQLPRAPASTSSSVIWPLGTSCSSSMTILRTNRYAGKSQTETSSESSTIAEDSSTALLSRSIVETTAPKVSTGCPPAQEQSSAESLTETSELYTPLLLSTSLANTAEESSAELSGATPTPTQTEFESTTISEESSNPPPASQHSTSNIPENTEYESSTATSEESTGLPLGSGSSAAAAAATTTRAEEPTPPGSPVATAEEFESSSGQGMPECNSATGASGSAWAAEFDGRVAVNNSGELEDTSLGLP